MLPFSFFLLLYRFRFSLSDFWSDFLSLSFLPSLIPSPVLLMQIMNSVPRPELGVKMVTWTCTNFKLKWMIRLIFFLPCIFYISHSHTHTKNVYAHQRKNGPAHVELARISLIFATELFIFVMMLFVAFRVFHSFIFISQLAVRMHWFHVSDTKIIGFVDYFVLDIQMMLSTID